jgi:uncharacterized membrane protein
MLAEIAFWQADRPMKWLAGLCAVLLPAVLWGQMQFEFIGETNRSEFFAISDDGTTVVGRSYDGANDRAAYWRRDTGVVLLPQPPGTQNSRATAVSRDGSTIVGRIDNMASWWNADGTVDLLSSPQVVISKAASAISPDGRIVGGSYFIIHSSVGLVWLGTQELIFHFSEALDISNNGRIVAGTSSFDPFPPSYWTVDGQRIELVPSAEGATTAITPDGSTIAGYADGRPFRWTEEDGVRFMSLDGFSGRLTSGITEDGALVSGMVFRAPLTLPDAALWADDQLFLLKDVVANAGIDLGDWRLRSITAISADGRVILGQAQAVSGFASRTFVISNFDRSFSAVAVPEPATIGITAIVLLVVLSAARSKRRSVVVL